MMHTRRTAWLVVLAVGSLGTTAALVQEPAGPARYTEQQAEAGRISYGQVCTACHLSSLRGSFEAPELAGPNFMNTWEGRSVRELFNLIQATMPPEGPSLSEQAYTNVAAYLLQANGVPSNYRGTEARAERADRVGSTAACDASSGKSQRWAGRTW